MKLALILGLQQGNNLKPRLQGIKDNLNIDCFDGVPDFIDNSMKRNSIYDRVLVLSNKVSETTMQDLYNFWGSTSRDTEVVLLCKQGVDEAKARVFLDLFLTPTVTVMLVSSTTVQLLAEAVLQPLSDLTQRYGIKDYLNVEVEEDIFTPAEQQSVQGQQVQAQPQVPQAVQQPASEQSKRAKKEKKGGLFSRFGKKNNQGQAQNTQQPQVNQNNGVQPMNQYGQPQQMYDQNGQPVGMYDQNGQPVGDYNQGAPQYAQSQQVGMYEQPQQMGAQQMGVYGQPQPNNVYNQVQNPEPHPNPNYDDNNYVQPSSENSMPNYDAQQSMSGSYGDVQNGQQYYETANDAQTGAGQVDYNSPIPNTIYGQNSNVDTQQSSSLVTDDDFSGVYEVPVQNIKDDFAPESVDMDFGSEGLVSSAQQEDYTPDGVVVEDEDFGEMNIGAAEEAYRQQTEAPKVVTREVVREVVRNVNTGSKNSALKGVLEGRLKKVVVVTGDRGTGVTSTALTIAQELSKSTEVLYFDCDIENHGLLSYIDYSNFKNYENTHQQGVKLCKSSVAFDRCVIKWEPNFYILTTDYSCDCTDEELQHTSEVVAERAPDVGVVVVDCPVSKLHLIPDLLLTGQGVFCVEASKRGFMNMLCQFENSTLSTRHKRALVSRGTMLITKCYKNLDLGKLVNYIKAIYEPDEVNWLAMNQKAFDGRLSDALLNEILEG